MKNVLKNLLCLSIASFIAISLQGCQIAKDNDSKENSNSNLNKAVEVVYVEDGEELEIDLDGDGKNEKVKYLLEANSECEDISTGTIYVNDVEYKTEGIYASDKLAIAKFPESKHQLVMVSDFGWSDDDFTTYFHYLGGVLTNIGESEGNIVNNTIKLYADNTIVANTRGAIFQTWWHEVTYKITGRSVDEQKQDFYKIANVEIFTYESNTLCDYEFYSMADKTSSKVLLKKGTHVVFEETDDKNFVKFSYAEGKETKYAYVYVEGFYDIDGNPDFTSEMLFDNILLAD